MSAPRVTADDVVAAYHLLFGREPESDAVVQAHMHAAADTLELVRNLSASPEFTRRIRAAGAAGRFFRVNGELDVESIVAAHMAGDPAARDDMAGWAVALRAVELARDAFVMVALGERASEWLRDIGLAARRRALRLRLAAAADGPAADAAAQLLTAAGFAPEETQVARGEALGEVLAGHTRIDLLRVEAPGAEAPIVEENIAALAERVACLWVVTTSRAHEGRVIDLMLACGWRLELERPCHFETVRGAVRLLDPGVQGWMNPRYAGD